MDSQFAERIDTLIRAAAVYSMAPDRAVYRSIASHDDRIVALSPTGWPRRVNLMRDSRRRRFIAHGSAGVHPDEMFTVMSAGIDRDWRIETHSIGDRAVRTLLDVYERLVASNTGIPAGHPS